MAVPVARPRRRPGARLVGLGVAGGSARPRALLLGIPTDLPMTRARGARAPLPPRFPEVCRTANSAPEAELVDVVALAGTRLARRRSGVAGERCPSRPAPRGPGCPPARGWPGPRVPLSERRAGRPNAEKRHPPNEPNARLAAWRAKPSRSRVAERTKRSEKGSRAAEARLRHVCGPRVSRRKASAGSTPQLPRPRPRQTCSKPMTWRRRRRPWPRDRAPPSGPLPAWAAS
jgi:hypothetical protein